MSYHCDRVKQQRSRLAALTRFRPANHRQVVAARKELADRVILAQIERAIRDSVPLSKSVRKQAIELINSQGPL